VQLKKYVFTTNSFPGEDFAPAGGYGEGIRMGTGGPAWKGKSEKLKSPGIVEPIVIS